MPRLFTGLEIPAEIGQTLSNLRGGLPGARWIDPENYHVTLRFIGDIDGVAANEIATRWSASTASRSKSRCRDCRVSAAKSRARWWLPWCPAVR